MRAASVGFAAFFARRHFRTAVVGAPDDGSAPPKSQSNSFDIAKAEIRAAVGYLLRGVSGGERGGIVQEIIAIVREVANGLSPDQPNPWTMVCLAAETGLAHRSRRPSGKTRPLPSTDR
jgi:hypothetical protein